MRWVADVSKVEYNGNANQRLDQFSALVQFDHEGPALTMKREYPAAPIVAVGVIVREDDRLVLVRRAKEPAKGLWTFPGGAVELGEDLHTAARREALEETGLEIEIEDVAIVFDRIDRRGDQIRYHYVIIDYFARPVGGDLHAGSDVSAVRWVAFSELDALPMTELARELALDLLGKQ